MFHRTRILTPEPIKVAFRRARSRLLDPFDRGVSINVSGTVVRAPGYFIGGGRADYELPSTERFKNWLSAHPSGLVVDVGCSVSTYGLIALCASAKTRVIGVDPDFASLVWTHFFCSKVEDPSRLSLVNGFVVDQGGCGRDARSASKSIEPELSSRLASRYSERTRYRFGADSSDNGILRHKLDDLLRPESGAEGMLIKIDVEGYELDVIAGASETLRTKKPTLLLSVHPQLGANVGELRRLLSSSGYNAEHFASDHEEHWWCSPTGPTVS